MATGDEEKNGQKGQLNKKVVIVSSGEKGAEKSQDNENPKDLTVCSRFVKWWSGYFPPELSSRSI